MPFQEQVTVQPVPEMVENRPHGTNKMERKRERLQEILEITCIRQTSANVSQTVSTAVVRAMKSTVTTA